MNDLTHIQNSKCILGEAPLYNESENSFYWSDIKDNKLYRYNLSSQKIENFQFSKTISSFAFNKNNEILATTSDGFEYLDLKSRNIKPLLDPEQHLPENRFNDGKCDANGRYFAGTMDNREKKVTGSLYCLDDLDIQKKEDDLFISNGLGWNKNSSKFYLTDSPRRVIYVYDYDLKTSKMSNKKVFANIDEKDGYPDGLCIDEEDYIWSAHWYGSKITRYNPNGLVDKIIDMPVPKITSCAFGGKDFKTLFVTTASIDLSKKELEEAPLSGSTFMLETNVKGIKPNFFK